MLQNPSLMTDFQGDLMFEQEIEGWTTGEQAESIRNYSMDQLKKDVREMLKTVDCQSGIWIFGYGSLMWNPDVRYSNCLLYTSPSPRDRQKSRMPSSA